MVFMSHLFLRKLRSPFVNTVIVIVAAGTSLFLVHILKSIFGDKAFMPLIEKPLRNFLETMIVHVIGIVVAYVIAITSCQNLSMRLRNDNPEFAALKRLGDNCEDSPCIGEQTEADLNRPWLVERMRKLPPLVDSFAKIWVIGRYKVGKTSLLNWLGVETARPSNLENTRGEIFYTSATWPNKLFVDTEGFDQPEFRNVTEPEFRKRLVLTHAHKAADAIILVVPMLTVGDMTLFQRNIKEMRSGRSTLFVVHNIQSITDVVELKRYRDIFACAYDGPINAELPAELRTTQKVADDVLITTHGTGRVGISVIHYFLGAHEHLWSSWNDKQVRDLSKRVGHIQSQGFELIPTLQDSLRMVGSSTYSFSGDNEVQCNIEEKTDDNGEDFYEIAFSEHITESLAREIGGNTILGCTLDYKWLPPRQLDVQSASGGTRVEYRQRLLIGKSRVRIVRVEITDTTTVKIQFEYWNALTNGPAAEGEGRIRYNVISGFEVSTVHYCCIFSLILSTKAIPYYIFAYMRFHF
jgi:hypothetical protein